MFKGLEPYSYALMRIMAGFMFAAHGSQKLFSFPIDGPATLPWHVFYIAGPLELIGGLLIMVGLFTGWAAFLCSGLMAAAYWMAHGLNAFWPIANRGETAALYCFVFLFIAARGSGIWSLDGLFSSSGQSSAYGATSRG